MRRIFCHNNDRYTYIDFYEFELEEHLKEFANLFTLSSGVKILRYIEGPGTTLGIPENNNSELNILWDDMSGCSIFAPNKNRVELMKTCYKMLCTKYVEYRLLTDLFDNIEEKTGKGILPTIDVALLNSKDEFEESMKKDLLQDLADLVLLVS